MNSCNSFLSSLIPVTTITSNITIINLLQILFRIWFFGNFLYHGRTMYTSCMLYCVCCKTLIFIFLRIISTVKGINKHKILTTQLMICFFKDDFCCFLNLRAFFCTHRRIFVEFIKGCIDLHIWNFCVLKR